MYVLSDFRQAFLFENGPVRGQVVRLEKVQEAAFFHHAYPQHIQDLLSDALCAIAMMQGLLTFEGRMTLQMQGQKGCPVKQLSIQAQAACQLRGFAHYQPTEQEEKGGGSSIPSLLGQGQCSLTLEPLKAAQRYQGIVPLEKDTLAECLADYFDHSEQLPTRFWFAHTPQHAIGFCIQHMPETENTPADPYFWEHILTLSNTLSAEEMLSTDHLTLFHRLFHQEDLRLYKAEELMHYCTCSPEKMKRIFEGLSEHERNELKGADDALDIRCDFCGKKETFDE